MERIRDNCIFCEHFRPLLEANQRIQQIDKSLAKIPPDYRNRKALESEREAWVEFIYEESCWFGFVVGNGCEHWE